MFFVKIALWCFFTTQYVLIFKHFIAQKNISITKAMTAVTLLLKQDSYVKKILLKKCYEDMYCQKTEYDMSCKDNSLTLIYSTNLNNNFIEKIKKNDDLEGYFFDTRFWYNMKKTELRLHVLKSERGKYTRTKSFVIPINSDIMIDGPNNDNYIMVVCSNNVCSSLFLTQINQEQNGYGYADMLCYQKPLNPSNLENNCITAVMIHPTENTIAYATKNNDIMQDSSHEIHIIKNGYDKKNSFLDSILRNRELNKPCVDYHVPVNHQIKKITFFGGNTYMFLTSCGKLGMCWLTKNKDGQTVVEYQIKKHTACFIDFEPDITTKTKNGYLLSWAFLSDTGEIYVSDFLMPLQKTTLFFVKQADLPSENEQFDRVYFNKQKCGVLYKNIDDRIKTSYTKLIMYE